MKQGDIYLARLEPTEGSEQSGTRPVVVISGNTMNRYFDLVIVCPLSSKIKNYAGCVKLKKNMLNGLEVDSEIITFQIRTISKARLTKRLGKISGEEFTELLSGLAGVIRY